MAALRALKKPKSLAEYTSADVNDFNHFLPRHARGEKYFSAQQVPKARSGPQTLLAAKS